MPELVVLGELAQAAADDRSDVGLEEAGMLFASRFVEVATGRKREPRQTRARDRRRAVEAAQWIDARSHEPIDLESAARQVELSSLPTYYAAFLFDPDGNNVEVVYT